MEKSVKEIMELKGQNYILPFMWMRGESEETIRREMEKIHECGIGAVCLEARPHPDFTGEGWWRDVDIVLEEAKKYEMKIWILDDAHFPTGMANGLLPKKYPERAKQYIMTKSCDITGPMPYAQLNVDQMMQREFTWMDIGKEIRQPLQDKKELLSVTAVRIVENDIIEKEYINLTEYVKDGILTYTFPEGVWRICVCFTTYDGGGNQEYINIIDRESVQVLLEAVYEPHFERYREEFGKTIAGFFSDEPGFGNSDGFALDESIGRKQMPLPWCREAREILETRLGSNWAQKLPYLWHTAVDETYSSAIRFEYMDIVTRLYEKNFSVQLGKWCENHGVEYIGHVIEDNNQHSRLGCGAGHYFRAMKGQHMAGIDNIGGQVIPGNPKSMRHGWSVSDGKFYQYVIGKMGKSAAIFDPAKKGRTLCETYGAYGWGFGVKSMKWVTDHLITQGVNYLVPHAFSMAKYPDPDCPPHFYAGGKNPQFPYFTELMKYANRLCHVFSDGQEIIDAAILYHGEMQWMNDCMFMQEPAQKLFENQIEYAILPEDVFTEAEYYRTEINGSSLTVNGTEIPVLIIPETDCIDKRFADVLLKNPQLPVIFVNRIPRYVAGADEESQIRYQEVFRNMKAADLDTLVDRIKETTGQSVCLSMYNPEMAVYHYRKECDLYMLFNESLSRKTDCEVYLDTEHEIVCYDALHNMIKPAEYHIENGKTVCRLRLEPYESVIFMEEKNTTGETAAQKEMVCERYDLSSGWSVSISESWETPEFKEIETGDCLRPISEKYPKFSGVIEYTNTFELKYNYDRVVLEAEYIFETATVYVNDRKTEIRLCPPYRFDLTEACVSGKNKIKVQVANTPARDVLNYELPFGPEKGVLEPTGMFGKIQIICCSK